MKFQALLISCGLLLAAVVAAQSAPPGASPQDDRWTPPAANSSTHFNAEPALPGSAGKSVFQFKQTEPRGPASNPPPQANDKAAVMGKQRPWQNGRPPVDCASQPRDPACH